MLSQITSGVTQTGVRTVFAGQEKMGKTTISCGAPNTLLIPCEVGFAGVATHKVPIITAYENLLALIAEITAYAQMGQFQYRTITIDSVTALERLIDDYIIRLDPASMNSKKTVTMESAHGGFGKAFTMAKSEFEKFLAQLDVLAVYGNININFTAHVFSSKVSDPTVGEYDSWDILLHSPKNGKNYGKREVLTQWADVVGFLYEPIYLVENNGSSRGISQNKGRVLAVSRTPSYTAGNRFGMVGEIQIPPPPENGWNRFAHALYEKSGIDIYTR